MQGPVWLNESGLSPFWKVLINLKLIVWSDCFMSGDPKTGGPNWFHYYPVRQAFAPHSCWHIWKRLQLHSRYRWHESSSMLKFVVPQQLESRRKRALPWVSLQLEKWTAQSHVHRLEDLGPLAKVEQQALIAGSCSPLPCEEEPHC